MGEGGGGWTVDLLTNFEEIVIQAIGNYICKYKQLNVKTNPWFFFFNGMLLSCSQCDSLIST